MHNVSNFMLQKKHLRVRFFLLLFDGSMTTNVLNSNVLEIVFWNRREQYFDFKNRSDEEYPAEVRIVFQ